MKTIVIKHYIPLGALTAALLAFCPLQTRADTIALSFTNPQDVTFPNGDATLGWAFTLSSPVRVTDLGLWDFNGDGLNESHVVTIWTSTGTLEAQGTIPSGTGATLTNGFRYVSIAPVLLPAGTYKIWAFYTTDIVDNVITSAAITSASGVSYGGSTSDVGLTFPSGNFFGLSSGYFGPNFQFTAATSVPDTAITFFLFGLSLMGLAFLRRKLC
jgi:hypothetical protein